MASEPRRWSLVLGMHPDETTDNIVLYAVRRGRPFAVCTCCVKPDAAPYRGRPGCKADWLRHVEALAAAPHHTRRARERKDKLTTWFTSDLHFGHKNIIKYCNRPFDSVEEMDEALVANWNAHVAPDDVVWNLGDFAFCCTTEHVRALLLRLNGRHRFIRGNHDGAVDELANRAQLPAKFDYRRANDVLEVQVDGQAIVLCHYPMRSWHHAQRSVWHLFGHAHGLLPPFGKSVDVGVDNAWRIINPRVNLAGELVETETRARHPNMLRPVSFEELKAFMSARPIGPHELFEGYQP